jgi:hypothetical protein
MFPYYFNPQNAVSLQCMLVVFPNDFLSGSICNPTPVEQNGWQVFLLHGEKQILSPQNFLIPPAER